MKEDEEADAESKQERKKWRKHRKEGQGEKRNPPDQGNFEQS